METTTRLAPIETALLGMGHDEISDVLVVCGVGHEDFPCSEMLQLAVKSALDPRDADAMVDGPVSIPVHVSWLWDANDPESDVELPATLTGTMGNGSLVVSMIEIDLTPLHLGAAT